MTPRRISPAVAFCLVAALVPSMAASQRVVRTALSAGAHSVPPRSLDPVVHQPDGIRKRILVGAGIGALLGGYAGYLVGVNQNANSCAVSPGGCPGRHRVSLYVIGGMAAGGAVGAALALP